MNDKLLTRAVALVALALATLGSAYAENPLGYCSDRTLSGDYAFRVSGEVFTPNGIVNRDGVAMTHFDGSGGLSQVDWVVANGVPVAGPPNPYGFHDNEKGS